jgi:peptidoglycan/xylan/chitin deacetylase (PgdA/CDA1 family)
VLTVDLEDYRRQELRDHLGRPQPPNPQEVERQLNLLLELLEALGLRATFFAVGRLTGEVSPSLWRAITARHRLGCHGYEHLSVRALGPVGFREDLHRAKIALEDASGEGVSSFRAPYFSGQDCDPWFGEALAAEGFRFDSSRRLGTPPPGFVGTFALPGSGGAVAEVPLPSIGFGPKRLTVIGGTYLRLLPLGVVRRLLQRSEREGFVPMVYLHPYDVDPQASPLEYPGGGYWLDRAGDRMRRAGRRTTGEKLAALARAYDFGPIESATKEAA